MRIVAIVSSLRPIERHVTAITFSSRIDYNVSEEENVEEVSGESRGVKVS